MLEQNENFIVVEKQYPHIASKLKQLWGTKECCSLFDELFFDTRDGVRRGFPSESAAALQQIAVLHDEQFPQFVKTHHIWFNAR